MYKDAYHPQVKKDLKKIDPQARQIIKNKIIPEILESPETGESLPGDLSGIRSYHFRYGKQQYRIAYIIDDKIMVIVIQMIAKRGDFYTVLKKRIKWQYWQ